MLDIIAHGIGLLGMCCVVLAFYKTVTAQWSGQSFEFNMVNLVGAILLLISLWFHFNLGSVIIELFWIAIALRGLWSGGYIRFPDYLRIFRKD